jgi:hypothetical protein
MDDEQLQDMSDMGKHHVSAVLAAALLGVGAGRKQEFLNLVQ